MATSTDPPPSTTSSDTPVTAMELDTSTAYHSSTPQVEAPTTTSKPSMAPPPLPPQNPNHSSDTQNSDESTPDCSSEEKQSQSKNMAVPYTIPPWSEAPSHPFFLEVLKNGSIIDNLDVTKKGAYMFGKVDMCDFVLEHPSISRFHAVLQFKGNKVAYLYDLGSTHGTFINKNQVKKKVYVDLHVGDVIRFGHSSRLYIFQGPEELIPQEADLMSISYAKDREASLQRAKEDAALANGISWGMGEDAVEDVEDDPDEITWQNYKGELTEKQQKTREKVLKRMEKIAHMKKEMAAIRAKDIAQGGLTQGQQTQIARNEMRISQIMEELESLEETLNDSIRESIGARAGKSSRGKQKGVAEDEDEFLSDDDEFYDRTKKKPINKSADTQSIETADTLLDKKEALLKEMEEKKRLLLEEKNKMSEPMVEQDAGDALDAYMSGLSSQLVHDRTVQLEKDLSSLQTEFDRIVYLLKIADPTGESAKKRVTTPKEDKSEESASPSSAVKKPEKSKIDQKKVSRPEKLVSSSVAKQVAPATIEEASDAPKSNGEVADPTESRPPVYDIAKPQWLGAVHDREGKESQPENRLDNDDNDEFVDYKERKKILESNNSQPGTKPESDLESAAPGLIIRKKKPVETAESGEDKLLNPSTSKTAGADIMAEDAVSLLLKHKRGIYTADEDEEVARESHDRRHQKQSGQDNKRPKRVLGPEKPAFLETYAESDYETWMPPEGQSGDGRTTLNDRLGY